MTATPGESRSGEGGSDARPARVVKAGAGSFRAVEAWRGEASGGGLCYFVALDEGEAADDDRRDRRAALAPDQRLEELSDRELAGLLEAAAPLTNTERRFRAPDGRLWLAQNVGPVWADRDPARGTTGLLFTALEGARERLRAPDGHAGRADPGELERRWRQATDPDRPAGNEDDAAGGEDG